LDDSNHIVNGRIDTGQISAEKDINVRSCMTKKQKYILIGSAGVIGLLLLFSGKKFIDILKSFLPKVEGFSSTPYWDIKQWSWGYGTRVPGSIDNKNVRPSGTITKDKAMNDAINHVMSDYEYLRPLIKVDLDANQWAAFLSFSYNLGRYNADNLIANINAQDWYELQDQWNEYIYAGGQISSYLVQRREKEWSLFAGSNVHGLVVTMNKQQWYGLEMAA
jgi:GH24 family phage-related lysozyme (muramidase)